jgi:hypothetical protein
MSVIFNSIVVDPFVFYAVIAGILLSMGVVLFLLIRSKNKKEDYVILEPIIIEDKIKQESDSFAKNTPSILDINKEAKIEVIKEDIKEEVNNESVVEVKEDILDNILDKMEVDLKTKKVLPTVDYETDQEEQAIISYKELLKVKDNPNLYVDDEIIELPSFEKTNLVLDEVSDKTKEAIKKFKNSEFISPVFGKVDNDFEYPKPKENPSLEVINKIEEEFTKKVDIKPLKSEYDKSEQFLNSLKDFRKNLE